jgi:hypothetical protein
MDIGNAAFDGSLEPSEAAFRVRDFRAQRGQARGMILIP